MNKKLIKKRQPLASQAADIIRDMILQGRFQPEERLNESAISSALGISRSPIREALKVLETEDLVINRGQMGSFVKNLSIKEVREIYAVTVAMQALTIRYVAERMNQRMEKELRSIMRRQTKVLDSNDPAKFIAAGREFHDFIVEGAGNDLLTKLHRFVRTHEERYRLLISTDLSRPAVALREHSEIAEALFKKDADKAEALIRGHLEKSCQRALDALAKAQHHNQATEAQTQKTTFEEGKT